MGKSLCDGECDDCKETGGVPLKMSSRGRKAGARPLRSPWRTIASLCIAFVVVTAHGAESPYPNRTIRWIVPLPPGGGADIVARTIAERLSKSFGQQVIIDNRGGGGTVIGAHLAAQAPADGYTWLLGTATTHAINASLVKKLPYYRSRISRPSRSSRSAADLRRALLSAGEYAAGCRHVARGVQARSFLRRAATAARISSRWRC